MAAATRSQLCLFGLRVDQRSVNQVNLTVHRWSRLQHVLRLHLQLLRSSHHGTFQPVSHSSLVETQT